MLVTKSTSHLTGKVGERKNELINFVFMYICTYELVSYVGRWNPSTQTMSKYIKFKFNSAK